MNSLTMFKRTARVALLAAMACALPLVSTIGRTEAAVQSTKSEVKTPLNFAHRGGRKWAPENTMSAFRKSVELGVDGIELDIHKCKSGELVVIHDDTVNRTTNGTGAVKDMTWSELSALDAGTWYDKKFAGEKLPLLKEVLDMVNGKLTINVEIKNCPTIYEGIDDDLIKMLDAYPYPDRIVISSFDHQVIHSIAKKTKKYKLALLGDSVIYDLAGYADKVGAKAWNPDFDCVREDSMKAAHDHGLEVNTWTVNKIEDWKKARDLHVDCIITDDPEGLKKFLQN
ncbi:MAG: glycerophosphodiester phosphodiesterase [Cyanobacteria bacterium SZAS LIN-2]|nr:glycerophosphodiester phosphodiesterase [Cyanobacteria bacterium SZAS LIN-2]